MRARARGYIKRENWCYNVEKNTYSNFNRPAAVAATIPPRIVAAASEEKKEEEEKKKNTREYRFGPKPAVVHNII